MAKPADHRILTEVYHTTRTRIRLRDYESIVSYRKSETAMALVIETYDVQELVREDRYKAKGQRVLFWFVNPSGQYYLQDDTTLWDDDFEPYVYEKIGRRKTAEETHEQREWEKLCYRPGTKQTPLDSYDRVCDPFYRSTDRMEGHF